MRRPANKESALTADLASSDRFGTASGSLVTPPICPASLRDQKEPMINACTSNAEPLHRDASSNRSSRRPQALPFDSPLGLGSRPFTIIHSRSRSFTIKIFRRSDHRESVAARRQSAQSTTESPCRSVFATVKKHTNTLLNTMRTRKNPNETAKHNLFSKPK